MAIIAHNSFFLHASIENGKGPVPFETALLFLDNVLNAGQVARNLKKKERKGKLPQ
jgi:polysaccharide deacetylase 2 family uncharacterized protein YibQ